MFIEHRTYSLKPGTLSQYFSMFGDRGFELHELMAPCLGWYYSEAGKLFEMTSLWHYDSFAQRLQRRANLFAMLEWRDLMALVQPLVNAIESRLVLPAPFWHGRTPVFFGLMPAGATAAGLASTAAIEADGVSGGRAVHRAPHLHAQARSDTSLSRALWSGRVAIHETHAPCVGFYYTEAGALFQLISMWQFDSFEQRLKRRAALNARADWKQRIGNCLAIRGSHREQISDARALQDALGAVCKEINPSQMAAGARQAESVTQRHDVERNLFYAATSRATNSRRTHLLLAERKKFDSSDRKRRPADPTSSLRTG